MLTEAYYSVKHSDILNFASIKHCNVSRNKQCQSVTLSCVFTWNTAILTGPCHHFMHCSPVHAKLIVPSRSPAASSKLIFLPFHKPGTGWTSNPLEGKNTFHLTLCYQFQFSINNIYQTLSEDDEINEKEIKGFSSDFWDGCFCFSIISDHVSSLLIITSCENSTWPRAKMCWAYKCSVAVWSQCWACELWEILYLRAVVCRYRYTGTTLPGTAA